MLAFLLLLPLGVVLGGLYWFATGRLGRGAGQRRHDCGTLIVTGILMLAASLLASQHAPEARGPIWAEVHAALWAFFTLLATLAAGYGLRPRA
jgi:hypothetical protein